jgi:hypothetical protein
MSIEEHNPPERNILKGLAFVLQSFFIAVAIYATAILLSYIFTDGDLKDMKVIARMLQIPLLIVVFFSCKPPC